MLLEHAEIYALFGRTKWTQDLRWEDQNWFHRPGPPPLFSTKWGRVKGFLNNVKKTAELVFWGIPNYELISQVQFVLTNESLQNKLTEISQEAAVQVTPRPNSRVSLPSSSSSSSATSQVTSPVPSRPATELKGSLHLGMCKSCKRIYRRTEVGIAWIWSLFYKILFC